MMKVIKSNLVFYQWQKDLIRGVLKNHRNSIHICKARRQCGKSVVAETIILKYAIDNSKSFSMYVSPTLKQSRKVFKEIKSAVENSSVFLKANESLLEIVFKNGSIIQFASAEQKDNLRGFTVSGILIIDEASFIEDDVFELLLPTTDANKAPILIISTPLYRTGFFYDYYIEGLDIQSFNIFSYDWSKYDMSDILSPERLEFYRQRMPKDKFQNEYLGLFTDLGSGIFGDVSTVISSPHHQEDCVFGIDWGAGVGNDETAICIFNKDKEMVDMISFNDKDETETIDYIIQLSQQYNPKKITVETNSIGQVFYGLLQKRLNQVGSQSILRGFSTNNNSKQRIVGKMQVAIQNKKVSILGKEKLLKQMSQFESKLTSAGKVTYSASHNGHDDCVMAMLIAFDSLDVGQYNII